MGREIEDRGLVRMRSVQVALGHNQLVTLRLRVRDDLTRRCYDEGVCKHGLTFFDAALGDLEFDSC